MPYTISLLPGAAEDIQTSYDWYEAQRAGLGELFLDDLETVYKKLELNPETFSWLDAEQRHASLKKFPFVVIFRLIQQEVYVYAVFHTSRNPTKI